MKYFISKMVVIRDTFSVILETLCWHMEELTFLLGFVNLPGLAPDPPRRPLLLWPPPHPQALRLSHLSLWQPFPIRAECLLQGQPPSPSRSVLSPLCPCDRMETPGRAGSVIRWNSMA